MANTYLTKTFSSAGNRKKWTWSAWIKRSSGLGTQQCLLACSSGATVFHLIYFDGNDKLNHNYNQTYCNTDRVFRDTSFWYHLVCAVDTTQATSSDRVKIFVNGEQETLSGNFPSQNTDMTINNNVRHDISNGGANFNGQFYFNGSMSHVHFIDGTAYDATAFGQYDANGVWTIKTSPSVTYGTNGFFILKDGNTITDQSSNSNDFTLGGGTLTKTEDCPSNVFCTINPLTNNQPSNFVLTHGNTKATVNGQWLSASATMGMITGKYYWELKRGSGNYGLGVVLANGTADNITQHSYQNYAFCSRYVDGWEFFHNGSAKRQNNNSQSDWGSTLNSGDIMMMCFDADTGKLFSGKNGTWFENGNPETGAYPMYTLPTGKFYIPCLSVENGNHEINFGNGYFGSTQISSAGTNASGNGIFEYDVPTGYTALSTTGLNL